MLFSVILRLFGHTSSLSLLYSSPIIVPIQWDTGQLSPVMESISYKTTLEKPLSETAWQNCPLITAVMLTRTYLDEQSRRSLSDSFSFCTPVFLNPGSVEFLALGLCVFGLHILSHIQLEGAQRWETDGNRASAFTKVHWTQHLKLFHLLPWLKLICTLTVIFSC